MEKSTEALDEVVEEFWSGYEDINSPKTPREVMDLATARAMLMLVAEVRMLRRALEPPQVIVGQLSAEDEAAIRARGPIGTVLTPSPDNARVDGADAEE